MNERLMEAFRIRNMQATLNLSSRRTRSLTISFGNHSLSLYQNITGYTDEDNRTLMGIVDVINEQVALLPAAREIEQVNG